jgi:hypothetical protein
MAPRHYLYPLNPKSKQGYYLEDRRGNTYPTSVEGFLDCYADGDAAEWGLSQLGGQVRRGDFIWVHFALPISAIMAVGRVREAPAPDDKSGRYWVWIDWDWPLTKRLQNHPIPYASHKQRVQKSVVEANDKTLSVINRWMKDKTHTTTRQRAARVTFKTVEVEQRQGQPGFRQALMVAYNYRCAVTGCDIRDTLQAAHITPVRRGGHHAVTNGLLLRADIHNLFDRGLLAITGTYKVELHPSIRRSPIYGPLHGKRLNIVPVRASDRPSPTKLEQHRKSHSPSSNRHAAKPSAQKMARY